MIWGLRHISLLFWLTALFTIPTSFIALRYANQLSVTLNPYFLSLFLFVVIFSGLVFLFDVCAKKMLAVLISDAQSWERAGIISRAEKKYIRAIRLFDSFLLFPLASRKTAWQLMAAVSRFYLNSGVSNDNFRVAAMVYLKMHPDDKALVRPWLVHLRQASVVRSDEQDVLSIVADQHADDPELSGLIADIFLGLERTDFIAHKVYTQIQENPELNSTYSNRIKAVVDILDQDVSDIEVAYSTPPSLSTRILPWLKGVFARLQGELKPWVRIKYAVKAMVALMQWFLQVTGSLISAVVLFISRCIEYLNTHERVRFYLKNGALTLAVVWLIYFMAGTVSHLVKTSPAEKPDQPLVVEPPKPFTIQVASYLKQSYADRYVGILKKQGLDASVKKVAGGGKTWYVVRVSAFADKKSAAAYGQKLKQQQIIDDFFVNNN
jgi:hypothetical protein